MIKIAITFKRKRGMTVEEFRAYRRDVHAPLLFAIPEAMLIKQFVVSSSVHAPNWHEASYDALAEEWFDSLADIDALYFCENFWTDVDPDHANFIDMSSAQG